MILTLICVLLIVVGIVAAIIEKRSRKYEDVAEIIHWCGLCLGIIFTFFCLIAVFTVQVNHDVDYANKLYEKEMLEYRIEHLDDGLTGNELLYNDIVEFNNDLRSIKKWAANPWTNWFLNQDIAALDYVELPTN